eukprot:196259-Pyramimonas_sp.AAC.1
MDTCRSAASYVVSSYAVKATWCNIPGANYVVICHHVLRHELVSSGCCASSPEPSSSITRIT